MSLPSQPGHQSLFGHDDRTATLRAVAAQDPDPTLRLPVGQAPALRPDEGYGVPGGAAGESWAYAEGEDPAQATAGDASRPAWSSPRLYAPAEEDANYLALPNEERIRSRAAAHWWGVLVSLGMAPFAWFLLADGAARLYWSLLADPAAMNPAGLISLGGGLLVLAIVLVAARWSSVGSITAGAIAMAAGIAFLAVPVPALTWLADQRELFERFDGFGENVYLYLVESATRGHLVLGGAFLVLVGVVSHGARRQGRREERDRIERTNEAARAADPYA